MTEDATPEDERLEAAFGALDPTPPQIDRMRDVVLGAYAPPPPLAEEWITLLSSRPVANSFYTIAAAAVLILGAVLSAVPWTLLSGLS